MFARIKAWLKPPTLNDEERTRTARTLNALLLLIMAGAVAVTTIRVLSGEFLITAIGGFVLFIFSAILLVMVRRGRVTLPSMVMPILLIIVFTYLPASDQGLHDIGIPALGLVIVLGALMLGRRGVIILTGLTMLSIIGIGAAEMSGLLVNTLSKTTGIDDISLVALEFGFIGLALYVMVGNLNQSLAKAQQANTELQTISRTLETKVEERVRDLALAVEVGNSVAQVRDLDALLQTAVNLIRERFGLYHAQIYLVDNRLQRLNLRAGTGNAGAELLQRGHYLPLNSNSINGLAAAEHRTVLVSDTKTDPHFRPNPLLPATRSEMSVPLMIEDRVLGVLNLQSDSPKALSDENLPTYQVVANQLAVAIQNANLFAEAHQARQEVEAYAQRLTREGWRTYLDAIIHKEQIGFVYDHQTVTPLEPEEAATTVPDSPNSVYVPITIAEESIGAIQLETDEEQTLNEDDLFLVTAVAQQVSQQIENIRLLNEADRYRLEAENAARRLTQEAWREYEQESETLNQGFVYDQTQVTDLEETDLSAPDNGRSDASTSHPLQIHNQTIGELEVGGATDEEAQELVTAVAAQLSVHLENLRLTEQTQQALSETERLYQISSQLNIILTPEEIIDIVVEQLQRTPNEIIRASLFTVQSDAAGAPKTVTLIATNNELSRQLQHHELDLTAIPATSLAISHPERPLFIPDPETDPRLDTATRTLYQQLQAKSAILLPLRFGSRWLGLLSIAWPEHKVTFSAKDERLYQAIGSQLAIALNSRRLFDETQEALEEARRQSAELSLINHVVTRVAGTLDLAESLQIVATELAKAVQVEQVGIAIMNENRSELTVVAEYFDPQRSTSAKGFVIPIAGNELTQRVLDTQEPIIVPDAQNHPLTAPLHEAMKQRGVHTLCLLPMIAGNEVLGTVGLDSLEPDKTLTDEQIRLAETLVYQAATVVQNAHLFEQLQIRAHELASLNQMGNALTAQTDVNGVLETINQYAAQLMDTSDLYVALYDAELDEVDIKIFGKGEQIIKSALRRRGGNGITEHVIRTRQPLLVNGNMIEVAAEKGFESFGRTARSWLGIPMSVGHKVLGVIAVQNFEQVGQFNERHKDLLTAVASQAAIALENVYLFGQAQARAEREQLLREITAKVNRSADLETIMRTAVQEVGQALGRNAYIRWQVTPQDTTKKNGVDDV